MSLVVPHPPPVDPLSQAAVEKWFTGHGQKSASDVLRDVFESSKKYFTENAGTDSAGKAWIEDCHSLEDLEAVLGNARTTYESKPTSKAFGWLTSFSKRVKHYGAALDVLAAHHPEYVALVWGAFKLIFGAVVNHEDQIEKLAKACVKIADILPRTQITLQLYQTDLMLKAVTDLYVGIMEFLRHAVKWYKQGKLYHAWTSVAKPWELGFQNYVEDITTHSRRIEEIANTSSHAELRATRLEACQIREEQRATLQKLEMLMELTYQSSSLHRGIQLDVTSSRAAIARIELNQILSLPSLAHLPTSGETIGYCQSMRDRRRRRLDVPPLSTSQLEAWSNNRLCPFMFTHSSDRLMSKDFLVDVVGLIREAKLPVIWAFRFKDFSEKPFTSTDLVKSLINQALQINPEVLISGVHPPTVSSFREAVDERDWLGILDWLLHDVPMVYILLDAELVGYAMSQNAFATTKLLELLTRVVTSTAVKVMVADTVIDESYAKRNWDLLHWTKVSLDRLQGKRKADSGRSVAQRRAKRRRRT